MGYDVTVYMEHIKAPEWNRIASSDIICLSALSAAADKTYALAQKIRNELKIPVIIGGTHATYFWQPSLEFCDYVVFGEGDEAIVELCDSLVQGGDVRQIAGIAYKQGDQLIRTKERPRPERFETIPNFELIKGYKKFTFLDKLSNLRLPLMTVQATRGCPYACKYCIVDTMYASGYAKRTIDSVIEDLRDKRQYGSELLFVYNNFAANRKYTKELLKRIIAEDFEWDIMVLTRVELANDEELLKLMRQAGITQLYQGYESISSDTLTLYDKRQTLEKISQAIKVFHSHGFRLSGSFVIGADTDTVSTIHSTAQFVLDQKLTIAYFFPLWGTLCRSKK